ncbi:polymorphic toxin-type HINT domain-containing protein [Streptomyces sp. MS06]|uniref:polymorphic toxin-type HINT domain-containing protein n=1 Tax=Streptomyces sp. MS06 TaxID=3385974 RepID=UPI0039A32C32
MSVGIGTSRRGRRGRRRSGRLLAQSLALALVVPIGWAQVAAAEGQGKGLGRPDVPGTKSTKVEAFDGPGAKKARQKVAKDEKANAAQARKAESERGSVWPKQGEATLEITDGKAAKSAKRAPGGLPVTVSRPSGTAVAPDGDVRVTVLDQKTAQKAGITGVLLTAEAADVGTAKVSIDYGKFASAMGGGWSQRLQLVKLPACVLTTPQKPECRTQTPLTSDNNAAHHTIAADVQLSDAPGGVSSQLLRSADSSASGATVLALTAASSGSGQSPSGAGDFSATKLSESSSWAAGGNSGSFTWSYGFTMPPAAAGPSPSLSLSYDSGSVDGRTATTNNQGTSVGEGFGLTESYMERTYGSCDDDGHTDVFDQCWKYDNATLVLNGRSTQLVKDDSTGVWHLANDDASTVTRSTGADNGDDNGEFWTVITGDGTKYVFGLNKLAGAGSERTNSVWTVPVFGDDSGEPGYANGSTFADRALTQAWRWNLDYVEDLHGNAATYWYTKETNYYKKNKATTANASYTRGGYLNRVEYGLRKGALFTDKPDAKVTFGYAERCTASDCSSLTKDTADNWPDVPFDAICSSGDTDCNASGPSFFTRKRLTGVNTYSYNAGADAYDPVDSWTLTQEYLDGGDIGDSSDQVLTLKSIKRTGKAGDTSIAVNPISFTYQMRPNRVDATDDILPLTRPRISTITSETGAITTVTLSPAECVRSELTGAAPDSNTRSCYPQYWHINGADEASIDWFQKYRVLAVIVSDPAGNNEAVEHSYSYSGAAWHYNDNPFTKKAERTWSDWRGYQKVTAYTGDTSTTRSKTVSLYMQGMHGDKNADGTTKTVTVAPLLDTDVDFGPAYDSDRYKGLPRQQVTYNGSQPISSVFKSYTYRQTASQAVPDAATQLAQWVRNTTTYTSTYLTASSSWRTHATQAHYDALGMVTSFDDYGQSGVGGDETCTRTWYARNPSLGITSFVSRSRTVDRQCSTLDTSLNLPATTATRGNVLSDAATVYDDPDASGWSAVQQPTKGEPTWTGRATGYALTADSSGDRLPTGWQTTATSTFDTLGRPLTVTDTAGHTTSTAYTPADAGPLRSTITTDVKGYRSYSYLDPRRGLSHLKFDINLKLTEQRYDALGRLTQVWLPNRSSGGQSPSLKFTYHMDKSKPSWVSTSTLNWDGDAYRTSYAIYDALLRPLQTQSPTPQGGRLLTDTRYDTRGLAYETHADIFDSTSTPNGTYYRVASGAAPLQTEIVYDGAGRPVTSTLYTGGVKKWSQSTTYTGDSTATTAVEGGSAQRAITDIRGRTTETRAYESTSPADDDYGTSPGAAYTSTKFAYALDGRQTSISGPDDATWTYSYDLFGRQVSSDDPDKGTTSTAYNALDQVIKSTDARGKSILSAYDELGRLTGTWSGSKTDANQLTAYTYDTVLKGRPTTSTRYVGGKTGAAYKQTITGYDSMGRAVKTQLELPASDPFVQAGEPSTLPFETHYNVDGTQQFDKEPAMGGLPSEITGLTYDDLGDVTSVGGATGYLRDASYSALSQLEQFTLGTGGTGSKDVYVTNTFEEGTGRLTRSHVTDQTHPYMLQDLNYTYDQAGNVTEISDPTTLGGSSSADTQCFAYDGHQRLTGAWTPASHDCTDAPDATGLAGPAPYWNSYTYNTAGQRTTETEHKSSGDATTTYCYGSSTQPHTLTGTSTTADCATPSRTYAYDATGNTTQRPGSTATQNLTWSPEGKLTKLDEDGRSTDYLYGAGGSLLIRSLEDGERILYAGSTELHLRSNGTTWAQRYYSGGGTAVAMRSNESGTEKLTYLTADHHGTSNLALNPDTGQTFTKRYTTPFGKDRGQPLYGPWPDDKGFLGKTRDTNTGLTHVGAREYDPGIGQFISVDPVLNASAPQSLNGYSYADNNPATSSDPTGLCAGIDCPTRPGPNFQNTTPGHVPGPPKLAGNVIYAGQGTSGSDDSSDSGGAWNWIKGVGSTIVDQAKSLVKAPYREYVADKKCVVDGENCMGMLKNLLLSAEPGAGLAPATISRIQEIYGDYANGRSDEGTGKIIFDVAIVAITHRLVAPVAAEAGAAEAEAAESEASAGSRLCSCKCSFTPSTAVLMANGRAKPIGEIKVGDKVESANPGNGRHQGPHKVTATLVNHDYDLVDLRIRRPDGSMDTLHTTAKHPFWDETLHAWVAAGGLRVGHALSTADDHQVQVDKVTPRSGDRDMYNLTVDDLHTYYVLAGETPVLVHNSTPCTPAIGPQRPTGVGDDWVARAADNGKGSVWQKPGSTGNADMLRVMNPTGRYPNGYVRFTNKHGQPIGLDGKPGSKADTHIPMNPDGTYPLPVGW